MSDILKKLSAIEQAPTDSKTNLKEGVEAIAEVTPPGREEQVKALKKVPGIDNPWAVSWASYNKGKKKTDEESLEEGFDDMEKYLKDKEKAKGTGKFDKTDTDKGVKYTKKYDAEDEKDEDEGEDTKSKGGRKVGSKSGARHSYKKIDEVIAEAYGDYFEGDLEEDDMEEGNKFINNLRKARAAGEKEADLDGDGDMEPVKPGKTFEEETIEERWSAPIKATDFYLVNSNGSPIAQSANEKDMKDKEQQYLRSGWDVKVVRGNELSNINEETVEEDLDETSHFIKGVKRFIKGKDSPMDVRDKHLAKSTFSDDPAEREKEASRYDKVQGVLDKAGSGINESECNHTMEGESCPMHGESKCPMSESADKELDEVRALAGLQECGPMSPIPGAESDMGKMNINTTMDSDGHKSVTISADGDAAVQLMQMLKLAGMGSAHIAQDDQVDANTYAVASEEEMEEEHVPGHLVGNGTEPQVMPVQSLTKGGDGEVAGKEKQMHPHGYKFSDNPLAMENKLGGRFLKEYESIKLARGK